MKILIVSSSCNEYGYEEKELMKELQKCLASQGHMVDSCMLPFSLEPLIITEQVMAYRMMDIQGIDCVITIGYPACFVKFHNKISYLFNTCSAYKEWWKTEYGVLNNREYYLIKQNLEALEKQYLKECGRLFCSSEMLRTQLKQYADVEAKYLPYPQIAFSGAKQPAAGVYVVTESCLQPFERIEEFLNIVGGLEGVSGVICVPKTEQVYADYLSGLLTEKPELSVTVYRQRMTDELLRGARAYVDCSYRNVRIPAATVRAAGSGKNILLYDDSSAVYDYLQNYKGLCCMKGEYSRAEHVINKEEQASDYCFNRTYGIEEFVKGLLL